MDDPLLMSGREPLCHAQNQRHGVSRQQTLLVLNELLQTSPGHEFHLEKSVAPRLADRVRGDDVRMHECRGGAPLADESFAVLDIPLPDARRKNFEGAIPPQVFVMSEVDPDIEYGKRFISE